jgi:biopolymer transport protein ExbB
VQFDIIEIFRKMSGFQWIVVGTLLAMAVASSAVTVERLWVFWRSRRRSREFAPVAARRLAAGEHHRLADDASGGKGGHLARLLAAGVATFLHASRRPSAAVSPAELARREMARQREAFDAELRRGMSVLASTGSVAPFVGLLGTVVGIIAAFEGIAKEGSGGLGAVSAGISEALVVTAFGLFVAIPTVLLFNFLSTRVERLVLDLDQAAGQLADHLEAGTAAPERIGVPEGAALPDRAGANGETLATA